MGVMTAIEEDVRYEPMKSVFNDRTEFARFFQEFDPVSSMFVPIRQGK